MNLSKPSSYVVFSGGSACNHILDSFHKTAADDVTYLLSISDDGGSSVRILLIKQNKIKLSQKNIKNQKF